MKLNSFYQDSVRKVKQYFRLAVFVFPLLLTTGFCSQIFTAAATEESARKQIYAAVHNQAAEMIRHEGKRRNWRDYQAKINIFIPAEASGFAACGKTPVASLPGGDRVDLHRLRFDVHCGDGQGWDVVVAVKPDIYLPVLVARKTLDRGHVITADNVMLKKYNITNTRGEYVTQLQDVVGLTVKRRARAMQPIALSQLESPVLVERGQLVVMMAEQNGVQAQTMGEALKKGRKGEMIKVKNESSKRIVSAIVSGRGVVQMVQTSEE
ncbi:flagellar basal body P-ring biosynthesis protein FlgA [Chania multitudinisentens RB-25]|uniref:Flagella basal body P-ring formation protein FlgA n=1 Tax=Chania multitudinisentens RB-25 TaxID=1441930 RepID=W0L776_9GAMM|nr:flagellar basal body P-ring formation chaperone FlgA [Chania multitudinisentens]AHG19668.2 flagellar basal body P-ring biosynthesis protein FlgA [Chania multitudinisentens RB-25]